MGFPSNTYVVLDLPQPVAGKVLAVRRHHRDEYRAALPAEITIAGSSGVGVFAADQDLVEVFSMLDSIAAETAPIRASFSRVLRFPGTDIFVLTLADEEPFRTLHRRIAASGLRFEPSPFPYTPHCTLRSRSPVTEEEAADLFSVRIEDVFMLDTLSVYQADSLPLTLLHRAKLTGDAG